MQNKPNFQDAQMNVSSILTKDYENKSNWTLGENKPNSNPIKANFNAYQNQTKPISDSYPRAAGTKKGPWEAVEKAFFFMSQK